MLIIITADEISKFPYDQYDTSEPPILISEAPYKFQLLAQNMRNYLCCGLISGDEVEFKASGIICEEVTDIPSGYEQRVFPYDRYGKYLKYAEITRYLLIENDTIPQLKTDIETTQEVIDFIIMGGI